MDPAGIAAGTTSIACGLFVLVAATIVSRSYNGVARALKTLQPDRQQGPGAAVALNLARNGEALAIFFAAMGILLMAWGTAIFTSSPRITYYLFTILASLVTAAMAAHGIRRARLVRERFGVT